jgi:hypothetical protein
LCARRHGIRGHVLWILHHGSWYKIDYASTLGRAISSCFVTSKVPGSLPLVGTSIAYIYIQTWGLIPGTYADDVVLANLLKYPTSIEGVP